MDRYSHHKKETPGSFILKMIKAREPIVSQEDKAVYCLILAYKIVLQATKKGETKEVARDLMHLPNENLEEIIFTLFSEKSSKYMDTVMGQMIDKDLIDSVVPSTDKSLMEDFHTSESDLMRRAALMESNIDMTRTGRFSGSL